MLRKQLSAFTLAAKVEIVARSFVRTERRHRVRTVGTYRYHCLDDSFSCRSNFFQQHAITPMDQEGKRQLTMTFLLLRNEHLQMSNLHTSCIAPNVGTL